MTKLELLQEIKAANLTQEETKEFINYIKTLKEGGDK